MPAPGWTGTHDWVDRIPFEELPRAANPASGRIVSANNRMVALDYSYYLTDDWAPPYRARRIETLLDARSRHDVASFTAIQQDLVSLAAARLTPVLLGLAEPSNDTMRTALAMLGE
ncbi:MAG: penicillin acylase family protein, partial [Rhodospirillales bacterium]|nr:penicillin acylase family protein [Rhodospirillales bacterium]